MEVRGNLQRSQGEIPSSVNLDRSPRAFGISCVRVAAGNPYGPAGTGKTESVKALGAALGRQVLVFNCDEGIDFQSMVRASLLMCAPVSDGLPHAWRLVPFDGRAASSWVWSSAAPGAASMSEWCRGGGGGGG